MSCELPAAADPVPIRLRRRIAEATGRANRRVAALWFRRHAVGEWRPPHTDTFEIDGARLAATALMRLDTPEIGGRGGGGARRRFRAPTRRSRSRRGPGG